MGYKRKTKRNKRRTEVTKRKRKTRKQIIHFFKKEIVKKTIRGDQC